MTFELLRNAFQGRILLALVFLLSFPTSAFAGFKFTSEEFKDGQWHQTGTQTWPEGQKYVGEFVNGRAQGKGTHTWPTGEKHVGEFKNGASNGKGTYTWPRW